MKKYYFLIALFFFAEFAACRCDADNLAKDYMEADFVGLVTVKGNSDFNLDYNLNENAPFYKAEIIIDKIIKGEKFEYLNIFGFPEDFNQNFFTTCTFSSKIGDRYLLVLKKNAAGEYKIDYCSRVIRLDSNINLNTDPEFLKYSHLFKTLEKHKKEIQSLRLDYLYDRSLKRIEYPNSPYFTDFGALKIADHNYRVGIYKLTFNKNGTVKDLFTINRYGMKDKEIEKLIRKNMRVDEYTQKPIPFASYFLMLYFKNFEGLRGSKKSFNASDFSND